MKKVAFIGTHGIGKTTLAHDLVSNLKKQGINADFLGELARHCPLPINEGTTKASQSWIILSQCVKEIEFEDKCDLLVCDRSALDGYIYYIRKFGRNKALETLVLSHLKSYDYLIKVPITKEFLKKDGIRSVEVGFQKEIDSLMDKILTQFKVDIVPYKSIKNLINLVKNGR